jgi:hypothetical protein
MLILNQSIKIFVALTASFFIIVAYLRHAKTVTSKHVPTITQQWTKLCFLHAEPSRAVTSRASPRLVCCQATAINIWMTQEWGSRDRVSSDATIEAFPACQTKGL